MKKEIKLAVVIVALIILSCGIVLAQEEEKDKKNSDLFSRTSTGMIILDVVVVRPVCGLGASISTVFCVITMPYAYFIGAGDPWYNTMIKIPWQYVRERPIGDF